MQESGGAESNRLGIEFPAAVEGSRRFGPADSKLISAATTPDAPINFVEVPRRVGTPAFGADIGRALQPWLANVAKDTLSGLTVINYEGIVVASSAPSWVGRQANSMEEVSRVLQLGQRQAVRRLRARVPESDNPLHRSNPYQIAVVIPIEHEGLMIGAVHALRTPATADELLWERPIQTSSFLMLFFLVPLGSLAAGQFFAVRPLARLQKQAALAADPESKAKLVLKNPRSREVADLFGTVKRMAENLRLQRDSALQQAQRLAHSLWNSLAPAESDAQLLRESADRMTAAEREVILLRIERSTRDGRRLAAQALKLAKAGQRVDLHGETDIEEVIYEVAQDLPRLKVAFLPPKPNFPRVDLEERDFAEVCRNLLQNAAQAGATNMVITANPRDGLLELRFRDDGAGVAESLRDTLLDPYVTSRPNEGGHGVGLAHVRAIV
ncbi:MAG: HAMP domain-containing sensor histidine kinase, partial [Candidatus Binatia bacterium]|nr:HAMP domain-containing sensor histidine kinase [Candidatus Binatia bacterium]